MDILVKKMNGYSINPSNNSFSILIIFSINSKSNFIYFKKKKKVSTNNIRTWAKKYICES